MLLSTLLRFFLSHKIFKINFRYSIRKSAFPWHLCKNQYILRFPLTCNVNLWICQLRHCRKKQVQNSRDVNPRQLQKFSYLIFLFCSSFQKTVNCKFTLTSWIVQNKNYFRLKQTFLASCTSFGILYNEAFPNSIMCHRILILFFFRSIERPSVID